MFIDRLPLLGASTIKWTALDACLKLSVFDSNYTLTLSFMKENIVDILKSC